MMPWEGGENLFLKHSDVSSAWTCRCPLIGFILCALGFAEGKGSNY